MTHDLGLNEAYLIDAVFQGINKSIFLIVMSKIIALLIRDVAVRGRSTGP